MATDPLSMTRRWFHEVWNEGKLDVVAELMAPGCVHRPSAWPDPIDNANDLQGMVRLYRSAAPDLHFEIVDSITEGEKTVARIVVTGTHTGEGMGVPPSGKAFRISGLALGQWRDGKLVEGWDTFDLLSLYEQIGALERPVVR